MRIRKTLSGTLRFENLPVSGIQNVRATTLTKDFADYVTITDDEVIFQTEEGPVEFDIVYPPGRFCLTCGEQLPGLGSTAEAEAENAKACREHCEAHGKKMVTDRKWPHGYRHMPAAYTLKARDTDLNKKLIAAKR